MEKGQVVDESGNEHFEMDIDPEAYPIDYITNFDEHLDRKPPERTKEKPHDENQSFHENPNKKKTKIKFVHTGNMVLLSKNNYFFSSLRKGHDSRAGSKATGGQ
jgi:hypothetical protein